MEFIEDLTIVARDDGSSDGSHGHGSRRQVTYEMSLRSAGLWENTHVGGMRRSWTDNTTCSLGGAQYRPASVMVLVAMADFGSLDVAPLLYIMSEFLFDLMNAVLSPMMY